MATQNLGIRFTEEKYATKSEMSKDLGTTLVDGFWKNVLEYRSQFNRITGLKAVDSSKLTFCYCPAMSDLIARQNNKIVRLGREFNRAIGSNAHDEELLKKNSFIRCLSYLSKEYNLDADETYLRDIVDGNAKNITSSYLILKRYNDALAYAYNAFVNPIDDNFLAEIFSRINEIDEITEFYRTVEDKSRDNRVLIDRVYSAVPVSAIEGMMSALFDFIKNSSLSAVVKGIITYYYINYIKPFSMFNDEIAILMMKAIIAHEDVGEVAILLPLESFLCDKVESTTRMSVEVQKTNDITYFVNYALKFTGEVSDEYLNYLVNFTTNSIRHESLKIDEPEPVVEEPKPVQQTLVFEEPKVEEPKVEEVHEEPAPAPTPVVAATPSSEQAQLAVSYIPPVLDEKEASRLEQDLLETDPSLKKGEAYFYARHCTMNKRYTIGQYKKALGCAYETARTSMEHLYKLGYYRKEQIKNKFVYTPISRRKGE